MLINFTCNIIKGTARDLSINFVRYVKIKYKYSLIYRAFFTN